MTQIQPKDPDDQTSDTSAQTPGTSKEQPPSPPAAAAAAAKNPPPPPPPPPGPPPDGGPAAWLQVAAGFLLFFNTWGMTTTFPVFQAYYETGALFNPTAVSASAIAWIGATQCFLLQLTGLVAGPVYDRGHLRLLLAGGGGLVVAGLMTLSLCGGYWQVLLAQGVCVGVGAGLVFTPTVAVIPAWFGARVGLAVGVASAGSSVGGVVYPVVLGRLVEGVGFAWAVRCVGFVALAGFAVPLAVMRVRVPVPRPRAVVDWSAFRDAPFMVFTVGVLILFVGNAVLIIYISFYPADKGFSGSSMAFYMAAIFNAGSVLGRIVPNAVSDRIGVFNTMAPTTLLLGVTVLCMLGVRGEAGMIAEAVVTGFFSGVVVALPPVCFRTLTENPSMIGTRIGQGFAMAGIGLLIGPPSAGAILGNVEPSNWTGLWAYAGVAACVAALLVTGVRVMRAGVSVGVKV